MPRSLSLALALLGGALAAASCYSERPAPPAFRYACDTSGDCRSNETCIEGLCQVECTLANAAEVCTGGDHLMCFNGLCTSGCIVEDEHCPSTQECIDLSLLGIEIDVGGGGFISSGSSPTGICANYCDDADPSSCPEGELCLAGFCVATCDESTTCPSPTVCQNGLCLPELGETSGTDTIPGTFTDTGMTDPSSSSTDATETSGTPETTGDAGTSGTTTGGAL